MHCHLLQTWPTRPARVHRQPARPREVVDGSRSARRSGHPVSCHCPVSRSARLWPDRRSGVAGTTCRLGHVADIDRARVGSGDWWIIRVRRVRGDHERRLIGDRPYGPRTGLRDLDRLHGHPQGGLVDAHHPRARPAPPRGKRFRDLRGDRRRHVQRRIRRYRRRDRAQADRRRTSRCGRLGRRQQHVRRGSGRAGAGKRVEHRAPAR